MSAYEEAWIIGPLSTNLYTRSYVPPAGKETVAALVFLHGFDEHIARYTQFHPKFSANGIFVFTYDQRGFGRTALDKEKKSKDSKYGKTCWEHQFSDAQWALEYVKKTVPNVPVFLMGHSMVNEPCRHLIYLILTCVQGGGITLGFNTRTSAPPSKEIVSSLAGAIALSPLILQAIPSPTVLRFIGHNVGMILPNLSIPADVTVEVS